MWPKLAPSSTLVLIYRASFVRVTQLNLVKIYRPKVIQLLIICNYPTYIPNPLFQWWHGGEMAIGQRIVTNISLRTGFLNAAPVQSLFRYIPEFSFTCRIPYLALSYFLNRRTAI